MRLPAVLALCALPAAAPVAVAACGGPAFTSVSPDAGSGAPPPKLDAGYPASFCALEAGTHTFCDDFDGPPLSSKWDGIDQIGAGAVAVVDTTTSDSPPASFKSIAPAALGETHGRLAKAFGTASRVVVSFAVSLDAIPPRVTGGGDSILSIGVGSGYTLGIDVHQDGVGYFENTTADSGIQTTLTSKNLAGISTLKGWTEIVLTVDVAHATLSVSVGGVQQLSSAPITPPAGTITVYLGARGRAQTSALAAHFDNATIDITQ